MQGNCGRYIKEIHSTHEEILKNIDEKELEMNEALNSERKRIFKTFDEKIKDIQEMLRKDEEKKKDS